MIKHFMLVALRNIRKNKLFSFINIIGFSIGLACCIIIFLWVQDELGYDTFHESADQILRVTTETRTGDKTIRAVYPPTPIGPALKDKYSEVVNFTRFESFEGWSVEYDKKLFTDDRLAIADPSFFEIFKFPFVKGDPKTALNERYSVVITEKTAKKYFGDEEQEAMGKIVKIGRRGFKVTGIIKNIPRQSHMQFGCIIPVVNMQEWWHENFQHWNRFRFLTYIQIRKDASGEELGRKILNIVQEHLPESAVKIHLQPLGKIHLYSDFEEDQSNIGRGNITYVYILSLVALIILIIACINFMNLSTARSGRRAREIAVKKIVGAHKGQLMKQFFAESILLSLVALVLAVIIVLLYLPAFTELTGKPITLLGGDVIRFILGILIVAVLTGIVSGIYPAFFLSAFRPVKLLSGDKSKDSPGGLLFRKVMVVMQFTFTTSLIIGSLLIYEQINFMRDKDLGFDKENLIYFKVPGGFTSEFESVKNELKKNPNVLKLSTSHPPILLIPGWAEYEWEGKDPTSNILLHPSLVDYDYAETLGMKIVEGRFFSREFPADNSNFVINEAAVKAMGLKNPVGKRLIYRGSRVGRQDSEGTIVGVLKDYHQTSLHFPIAPQVLFLMELPYVSVRISPVNVSDTVQFLEKTIKKYSREKEAVSYNFLDETLDNFYQAEKKLGVIFQYFTFLAIFISCLGLLGLVSYMVEQRTKEIGIRKVLGASIPSIMRLFSKEYVRWLLLANVIAWPLSWYVMSRWLQNFTYRIGIYWWMFVFPGIAVLVIAFFTVSYQVIKASRTNPIENLRYE